MVTQESSARRVQRVNTLSTDGDGVEVIGYLPFRMAGREKPFHWRQIDNGSWRSEPAASDTASRR